MLTLTHICYFLQASTVEVQVSPYFIKQPVSQVYPTAKTVRFECEVGGNPTPTMTWLKNGEVLHINGRIKQRENVLVLSNTVTSDSGLYQCVGKNSIGENWTAARLLVNVSQNQPDPPHVLHCNAESSSEIRLDWESRNDTRKPVRTIKAYTVHYVPTGKTFRCFELLLLNIWVWGKIAEKRFTL